MYVSTINRTFVNCIAMFEFDMVKLVILLLTGPFIEFDCSSERDCFYLKIYGKLTGLSNKFEPTMVFDPSEFEGPRVDCNSYAIATGDKNTNDKARLFKYLSGRTFGEFI